LTTELSPLTAGLGWTVKLGKPGDFVGKAALVAEKQNGSARKVVFFRTGDRRIVRADTPVRAEGKTVGRVLSGTLSPMLNEAIGSALIEAPVIASGAALTVELRGAVLPLTVVKPPLVPLKQG